ncbi:hypothetical protein BJY01DRAFT_163593 [Aspergillus pseudoustus]|uniref:Uncharacterized protein n=1 Tax=Aspergillus pseudoustus TaxID=1810923 RepID=A0ABR4IAS9_9EURO
MGGCVGSPDSLIIFQSLFVLLKAETYGDSWRCNQSTPEVHGIDYTKAPDTLPQFQDKGSRGSIGCAKELLAGHLRQKRLKASHVVLHGSRQ